MKNKNELKLQSDISNKKSFIWIGFVIIGIALATVVYFYLADRPSEFKGAKEKVTLGISRSFLSIPVYIAKKKGYFSDEGIDIKIIEYSSGKIATKKMFSEEVDISTAADMPIVFNSFKRQDFCVFATFTSSYSFVSLLTRKDTGIKSGFDLKGKKVGINQGTSSHFFLAEFLADYELLMTDVEIFHFKTVDLPNALKDKKVDAISVWQPYTHIAEQLLSANVLRLPNSEIYRTTFNFATMKSYAQDHKGVLERFTKALIRSSEFIQTHREESQRIIAEALKIEKETVITLWDGYNFKISLDQALLVSWDSIGRWSIDNNFTDKKKIPNYLNYIYLDALDTVQPDLISIIR